MSLTRGGGPLSGRPAGIANLDLGAHPGHALYWEPYRRRIRGVRNTAQITKAIDGQFKGDFFVTSRVRIAPLSTAVAERVTSASARVSPGCA